MAEATAAEGDDQLESFGHLLGHLEDLCHGEESVKKDAPSLLDEMEDFIKPLDDDGGGGVNGGNATAVNGSQQGRKGKTDAKGSATTWLEDEKSWEDYQGLSVVERMEKVKTALKEGVVALEEGTSSAAVAEAGGSSPSLPSSSSPEELMSKTSSTLQQTLPPELRASLPWSALINLINSGFSRVGWSIMGADPIDQRKSIPATENYKSAFREALQGVVHWLPDAALDHSSAPTVDPASLGPELTTAEYQGMWPVRYPDDAVLRVIPPDFPQRPYKTRDGETTKGRGGINDLHWGQRKLFMNELELLTLYGNAGDLVIYAGAAPGKHIAHLAGQFFPEISFVLIDPAPFTIKETERIKLVHSLMTDELAKEYAGRDNVILISDIRRTYASEDLILEDMMDQQRWHDLMRPKVSMFKFRLPWRAGQTEYLDGEVYTQPYAKPRSTETRLIVKEHERRQWDNRLYEEQCFFFNTVGHERRQWDNRLYEEQCFFFNTVVRTGRHHHGVEGAALENTWDHAAEVEIWRAYKMKTEADFAGKTREEQNEVIAKLSVALTQQLEGFQGGEWLRRCDRRLLRRGGGEGWRKRERDWRDDGGSRDRREGDRRGRGGGCSNEGKWRRRGKER